MPTYEYQCTLCGHQLEAFQKMSDAPLAICPKCNQSGLIKQVSAPAFQLKGSGWYKTDYAQKPHATTDKKDEGSKETKTENEAAKPATKESDTQSSTKTKE